MDGTKVGGLITHTRRRYGIRGQPLLNPDHVGGHHTTRKHRQPARLQRPRSLQAHGALTVLALQGGGGGQHSSSKGGRSTRTPKGKGNTPREQNPNGKGEREGGREGGSEGGREGGRAGIPPPRTGAGLATPTPTTGASTTGVANATPQPSALAAQASASGQKKPTTNG